MSEPEDDVQRFAIWLFHAAHQAEAHAERVNRLVRRLAETSVTNESIILGPIVKQYDYSPTQARSDSALVVQAVLHLVNGLAVVFLGRRGILGVVQNNGTIADRSHEEVHAIQRMRAGCEGRISSTFPNVHSATEKADSVDEPIFRSPMP